MLKITMQECRNCHASKFFVTAEDLRTAGGYIACEYCECPCYPENLKMYGVIKFLGDVQGISEIKSGESLGYYKIIQNLQATRQYFGYGIAEITIYTVLDNQIVYNQILG